MSGWQIIHGDALDVMRDMEAESVDAVVTDPPYGLGFMGKAWDSPGGTGDFPMRRSDPINTVNTGVSRQGGRQRSCSDFARRQLRDAQSAQEFHAEWAEACLRVLKPGGHLVAFGGTRTYHRLACAVEDTGFEIRDMLAWLYGQGFPKSLNLDGQWKGWGTALKPAHEPIVLARKPLIGTVARNVQEHGTGAINVDGCRVGTERRVNGAASPTSASRKSRVAAGYRHDDGRGPGAPEKEVTGRWPPNVLLDDEAAEEVDRQSGDAGGGYGIRGTQEGGSQTYGFKPGAVVGFGDSGTASRFFPRFRYTAKASTSERGDGNTHPTVKPVSLMQWLVRLVTPPGVLVLDPFAGSGSTLVAATRLGFRCIGIEREEEYVKIARGRLEGDAPLLSWRSEETG